MATHVSVIDDNYNRRTQNTRLIIQNTKLITQLDKNQTGRQQEGKLIINEDLKQSLARPLEQRRMGLTPYYTFTIYNKQLG